MSRRQKLILAAFAAAALGAVFFSCMFGSERIPAGVVVSSLQNIFSGNVAFSSTDDSVRQMIVNEIRLPRALGALLCGSALGMAGAALQGLFRNPLADPGLIGVSSGGALGALLVFAFGGSIATFLPAFAGSFLLPFAAMAGALFVTLLVLAVAGMIGHLKIGGMLLVGIAVNSAVAAISGLILHFAADNQIRTYTFWMLGGLDRTEWFLLAPVALLVVAGALILPRFARALDALALGEGEAAAAGVNVARLRDVVVWSAAAMVGAAVSVGGMIGFVGLVAPHLVRISCGPGHRFLLPASALIGGILLVFADVLARVVGGAMELPLGVVTAIIGAPFFLGILLKGERRDV